MRYRTTRTQKEDGKVNSYEYVWVDGKLISTVFISEGSTYTAKYLYNDFDEPVGMVSTGPDGTLLTYYYLKNAQGDITNIISANGSKLVKFTYDVFGNRTVQYQADPSTMTGMIYWLEQVLASELTPFGYRGYCYDTCSGLYYLQSRYYDPQTGRFINSDDANYLNATGTVLGCNLFAYCENDPVNRVDEKGFSPVSTVASLLGFATDCLMAYSHYNHNITYDSYVSKYINGQGFWPYSCIKYGAACLDYNGCEIIAIYNALRALKSSRKLSKIIFDFELHGATWLKGVFGTKPQAIGSYLKSIGLKTKSFFLTKTMDKYVMAGRIFIICFAHSSGIHTVMAKGLKNGKIMVYNRYSDSSQIYKVNSIKDYVATDGFKLIIGYYVYK